MALGDVRYDPYEQLISSKHFASETAFMAAQAYSADEDAVRFRKFAVSLIQELSKCENFDALVPYLAMNYFDRVVSRCDIPPVLANNRSGDMKLFVVSCLTLASKIRTHSFKLSIFLIEKNLPYEAKMVKKMEMYICRALEWRLRPLTPLGFSEYFIYLLQPRLGGGRFPRRPVRQIIINSQAYISFVLYKPSIIGASAVLVVSSKLFPAQFDVFKHVLSCCDYIKPNTVELSKCMREIEPLYKPPPPPPPPPSEASSSSQHQAESDEPSGSRTRKLKPGEISPRLLEASAAPGVDLNEVIRSSEPVKEITLQIEPKPKPGGKRSELDDELMNFELEWPDNNGGDEERANLPAGPMGRRGLSLVQMLANCCPELCQRISSYCHIL